jgi:hypothetical protein
LNSIFQTTASTTTTTTQFNNNSYSGGDWPQPNPSQVVQSDNSLFDKSSILALYGQQTQNTQSTLFNNNKSNNGLNGLNSTTNVLPASFNNNLPAAARPSDPFANIFVSKSKK